MSENFMFSYPKVCLNKNCKHQITQKSHLGWMPCNFYSVYCVLMCTKCESKFKIKQHIQDTFVFFQNLPEDRGGNVVNTKISPDEIKAMKLLLDSDAFLKEIGGGMMPGVSQGPKPHIE